MEFESLPTTPPSEELLDKAFSKAARVGKAQYGVQAQRSMLRTSSNILSDNLEHIVQSWPDFDSISPFYYELADILVEVGTLRKSLGKIQWASIKTKDIGREHQSSLIGTNLEQARDIRRQAFARMASVVRGVSSELILLSEARDSLRHLPTIDPGIPTVVVAGYPNVGKSSFVNVTTNARNEIASYPFTTRGVLVGHIEQNRIRYQLIDTPGLLDRSMSDRNDIEKQAISALRHVADCILFLIDASETCGYSLENQLSLRDEIKSQFEITLLTVCSKSDLSTNVESDYYLYISSDPSDTLDLQTVTEPQILCPSDLIKQAISSIPIPDLWSTSHPP